MAVTDDTLRLLAQLRDATAALTDSHTRDLIKAYAAGWDEVAADLDAALLDLAAGAKDGTITGAQVRQSTRLRKALEVIGRELDRLAEEAGVLIAGDLQHAVDLAGRTQAALTGSQLPPRHVGGADLLVPWDRVDEAAVRAIIERTTQQIHAATLPLSDEAVRVMKRELVRGVAGGSNPNDTAARMLARCRGEFEGGAVRAIRIARTETLDAMRAAARLSDRANADVVTGWTWVASMTERTCFPAGTLILTKRGLAPIEGVTDGDVVMTHGGRWRRAYGPMVREYSGDMVTVSAGALTVTSTADHPFLIEREGQLQWVEARGVRRGDYVISNRQSCADGAQHVIRQGAIERCCQESYDRVAAALEKEVLAGVSVLDPVVPVRLVNLQSDVPGGDDEVDRALPSSDSALLNERQAQSVQAAPDVRLGLGFPGVFAIASNRAESGSTGGDDARLASAGKARHLYGRPTAFLGAVRQMPALSGEHSSTAQAGRILNIRTGALHTAVDLGGSTGRSNERARASSAFLFHTDGGAVALAGAVRSRPYRSSKEGAVAGGATSFDSRPSRLSPRGVRIYSLMRRIAGAGTELPGTLPNPRRRDLEMGAAVLASPLHRHIVSSVAFQIQSTRVYNFEVEEDHSYIANGFAVHNCAACWAMHGSVHKPEEPGPHDHQNGRCARSPLTKSWAELGFTIPEPPSVLPDGPATFAALGPESQRAILGGKRYDAWQAGDYPMSGWASWRSTSGWRDSIGVSAL